MKRLDLIRIRILCCHGTQIGVAPILCIVIRAALKQQLLIDRAGPGPAGGGIEGMNASVPNVAMLDLVAKLQTQRDHLHGGAPSSRDCTITRASTYPSWLW
jgi:hypothetical protein